VLGVAGEIVVVIGRRLERQHRDAAGRRAAELRVDLEDDRTERAGEGARIALAPIDVGRPRAGREHKADQSGRRRPAAVDAMYGHDRCLRLVVAARPVQSAPTRSATIPLTGSIRARRVVPTTALPALRNALPTARTLPTAPPLIDWASDGPTSNGST